MEVIHIKKCNQCDSTDNLMRVSQYKSATAIHQYYICRTCNKIRANEYYHSLTGEKKKVYYERANRWNKTEKGKAWIREYHRKKYAAQK